MDSFIFNKHRHRKIELDERKRTTSTVLVPEELILDFKAKVKVSGGVRKLFKMLLDKYRIITHSGALPEAYKLKTEFQEDGQDLQRVNFIPDNDDWLELGQVATFYGKSRCWIFTYLLRLEVLGFGELMEEVLVTSGVPITASYQLQVALQLQRVLGIWTRSYHVKV
jgi:hypothetical protein